MKRAPVCDGAKWNYYVVKEWQEEFECVTCGIAACDCHGQEIGRIQDITQDETFAANLAKLFTAEGLEPIHFADVVSDFLACPQQLDKILGNNTRTIN